MFVILVRDAQGRLAKWGNPDGYLIESRAKDAAENCFEDYEIGEGENLESAKRNAKYKFAQKYKNAPEMAHRNVRSRT